MKYLVFSDSHLTDRFEPNKCKALLKAIDAADRVIINGDFWDGYLVSFNTFVTSQWSTKLFPLLKKKQAVYIFGNHDTQKMADNRTRLFSNIQTNQYKLTSGGKTFIFEHGHRIAPMADETLNVKQGVVIKIAQRVEKYAVAIIGPRVFFILYAYLIKQYKKSASQLNSDEVLVVGHTNTPEIDLDHKYINTGYCNIGLCHYVLIDNGTLSAAVKKY